MLDEAQNGTLLGHLVALQVKGGVDLQGERVDRELAQLAHLWKGAWGKEALLGNWPHLGDVGACRQVSKKEKTTVGSTAALAPTRPHLSFLLRPYRGALVALPGQCVLVK